MGSLVSKDKRQRDEREALLKTISGVAGTPAYLKLLRLLELELDITKSQMLDATGDALVQKQGGAIALQLLIKKLRTPRPSR